MEPWCADYCENIEFLSNRTGRITEPKTYKPSLHGLLQAKALCIPRQNLSFMIIFVGIDAIYFSCLGDFSFVINAQFFTPVIRFRQIERSGKRRR